MGIAYNGSFPANYSTYGGGGGAGVSPSFGQNGIVIISLANYSGTPSYTGSFAGGANVSATTYTSGGTTYKVYSFTNPNTAGGAAVTGTVTF